MIEEKRQWRRKAPDKQSLIPINVHRISYADLEGKIIKIHIDEIYLIHDGRRSRNLRNFSICFTKDPTASICDRKISAARCMWPLTN